MPQILVVRSVVIRDEVEIIFEALTAPATGFHLIQAIYNLKTVVI